MIKLKLVNKGQVIVLSLVGCFGMYVATMGFFILQIPQQYRDALDAGSDFTATVLIIIGSGIIFGSIVSLFEVIKDIPADQDKLPDFIKQEIETKAKELLEKAAS